MYRIIRCLTCREFTYVDQFQEWRLCPVCGEAIAVLHARSYLEVHDHSTAEHIIRQIEDYLKKMNRKDLSPAEVTAIRAEYSRWIEQQSH
ncbi:MAG: DUF1922 domain-containing protein [Methanomicrobiales archaeon]|jgi:Zn finger protein HypA/HybF involved in hydrogenase expression|nr:DUF1922 domain-containing protein [Methanomicrobiales archaeon]